MEDANKQIRTRIAPSPTGYPHIGTIYQALFNYAYAKKHHGAFLVRIEDTDRARFVQGSEDVIFSSLDWANLPEDESSRKDGKFGPYRQSERLSIYHQYAQNLLDSDLAYFDYYPKADAGQKKDYTQGVKKVITKTSEQPPKTISEMIERGDWIVRMRVPKDKNILVQDEIRGEIVFAPEQVTEQVLIKSDGFPTYHLAAVVDDHLMGITHVVRGEEWISSAPKHVLLYKYFGWHMPLLYHTPLLRNPDKSKLSKRHGHTDIRWYQKEGYMPEAILNYLALMGWTHPEEKEIFALEEFIHEFDLKDIRQVGPVFDLTKLTWMNGEYIRQRSVELLVQELKTFHEIYTEHQKVLDNFDSRTLTELVTLAQSRIATLKEFYPLIAYFLPDAQLTLSSETDKKIVLSLQTEFEKLSDWNKDTIMQTIRGILKEHNIKMPVLYSIITGQKQGLPLPESLQILGQQKTLAKIEVALQK